MKPLRVWMHTEHHGADIVISIGQIAELCTEDAPCGNDCGWAALILLDTTAEIR